MSFSFNRIFFIRLKGVIKYTLEKISFCLGTRRQPCETLRQPCSQGLFSNLIVVSDKKRQPCGPCGEKQDREIFCTGSASSANQFPKKTATLRDPAATLQARLEPDFHWLSEGAKETLRTLRGKTGQRVFLHRIDSGRKISS
jgi:hypothetical protein